MNSVNPHIFREYDIRGTFPEELNAETAYLIGLGFASLYKESPRSGDILIGRDCRLHSDEIFGGLAKGITDSGLNVKDIGLCTTPMLYFAAVDMQLTGGIMITGSHNPANYNGLKMLIGDSTIFGENIQKIKKIIKNEQFDRSAIKGTQEKIDIKNRYIDYLTGQFSYLTDYPEIKVAVDCGNGCASLVITEILQKTGCRVVPVFCEVDGAFPNHHPDPTVEDNLFDLKQSVSAAGAEIGIAFDGDADRLGAIDEKGRVVWGDKLLYVFSKALAGIAGAQVIGEVKCSQTVYDHIAKLGVEPIIWKTGHSLIKQKMKDNGARIAGEMSGHFFFADRYFGYDDGVYAALRLIELLKKTKQADTKYSGLSTLIEELPVSYPTPEIRTACPDDKKFGIVHKLTKDLEAQSAKGWDGLHFTGLNKIDGVRVKFKEGWGLIRASNTQPALILRFEGYTKADLAKIQQLFNEKIAEYFFDPSIL